MFRRTPRVRPLRPAAATAALDLALRDPVANALGGSRLRKLLAVGTMGREFAIHGSDQAPDGVLWHGVNIGPVGATCDALLAFAEHLSVRSTNAGSIVGPREQIETIWDRLAPAWELRVRQFRWSQPLLQADTDMPSLGDVGLRPGAVGEADAVFPAAVAMFREEVGVDPTLGDGGRGYRRRVHDLLRLGRTYVVTDQDGAVVFKADVGAVFGPVAQIHGVWVRPELRGMGIARRAMAQLVPLVRAHHAPIVSLYVNDFNEPARRAYAAAGFRPVGELSTILF